MAALQASSTEVCLLKAALVAALYIECAKMPPGIGNFYALNTSFMQDLTALLVAGGDVFPVRGGEILMKTESDLQKGSLLCS